MAALFPFPVTTEPPSPDLSQVDSRSLAFRALDGTYPFPARTNEFFFMPDITGLDMPPRQLITKTVPGVDGEFLKEIRVGKREVFLPLWMRGVTHAQYLDRRDELASLFDFRHFDYRAAGGTFDLVANSDRGERSLRCVYVDGMTSSKWPNESAVWAKLGLGMWACQPYWDAGRWTTGIIRQSDEEPDFFAEFPPQFSSSRVLGVDIPVNVEGDSDSWITVDLGGPASAVTVSGGGITFTIPAGLSTDQVAQIVTDPRGRGAWFDGVKDWTKVGPTTSWRPLPAGPQKLTIAVTGTTEDSWAEVSGRKLFERPW